MAGPSKVQIDLIADDQASRTIDQVAGKVDALESADAEIDLTADDNATRTIEGVAEALTDVRTAGQRAADELARMATTADAELTQAKVAAEALARSLGPELAAKADMGAVLADLRKMGLTFEDITADADTLAASMKAIADVDTRTSAAGLGGMKRGLDDVRDSADQSRSVMANLTGNAAQDTFGALGGAAGSAGVAIGQLAEYATEGNISLRNLANLAGPMAGVAVAVQLLTSHMAKVAASKAFDDKRVKDFASALDDAKVSAAELQDILAADKATGIFVNIDREARNVEESVARVFDSFEQFNDEVAKGAPAVQAYADALRAEGKAADLNANQQRQLESAIEAAMDGRISGKTAIDAATAGYEDEINTLVALAAAVKGQADGKRDATFIEQFYGDTVEDTATALDAEEAATQGLAGAVEGATRQTEAARRSQERLAAETQRVKDQFDRLRGAVTMEGTFLRFQQAAATALESTSEGADTAASDILAMKQAVIDVAEYAGLNPIQVRSLLQAIDNGNIDGVRSMVEAAYNRNPADVATALQLPSSSALAGFRGAVTGAVGVVPIQTRAVLAGTAAAGGGGGAVGGTSVHVTQYLPRGYRGDVLADAERAARRSGGLYRRARR